MSTSGLCMHMHTLAHVYPYEQVPPHTHRVQSQPLLYSKSEASLDFMKPCLNTRQK